MKRVLFKSMATLAVLLGAAGTVWAHGVIARAEPPVGGAVAAPPAAVRLWFTEPFDPAFSGLEVRAADSQTRVDLGDVRIDSDGALSVSLRPNLPPGAYIVAWRVFTPSDGHQTSGSYSFGVGVPAAIGETVATERTPLGDAVRFLWFSGLAVFVGVAAFRWGADSGPALTRRLFWPVQYVRVALGLGLLGGLYVQTQALQTGVLETLGTQWGAAWLLRAVMTALVIARAHWLMRTQSLTPGLMAGGFLALATALTSHSAAKFGWPGIAVDAAHLLAASVWLGGVLCAAILLTAGERRFLPNFSILATAAVGVLAASGAWLANGQVGSWGGLLFTEYGRALLLKLAAALLAFGMGAVNALRANRVVSVVETATGLGVLLLAAVLTNLPPAYSQPTDGAPVRLTQTAAASGLNAALTIWPARRGANTVEARLERGGQPVTGAAVRAQFVPVDTAPPGSAVVGDLVLTEVGGGVYSASGAQLTNEGEWQVLLAVDETHFLNFAYSVGPDGAVRAAGEALGPLVALVGWLNRYALVFGAGLLLLGAAVWSGLAWRTIRTAQAEAPGAVWAIWLAPGLLAAGAIWLWLRLLF